MIKVFLNNELFRYDLYQIVNLFYDFTDIIFVKEQMESNLSVIVDEKIRICSEDKIKEILISDKTSQKEQLKKAVFQYLTDKTKKNLPWGTLVGIRPTKNVLSLMEKGYTEAEIIQYMTEHKCTDESKSKLCIDIVNNEKGILNKNSKTVSVYINMPFCPTKCLYCSFTSNPVTQNKKFIEPYLEALFFEMKKLSGFIEEKGLSIQCVYFGGGTPTAVNEEQFRRTLKNIFNYFVKDKDVTEFTVECGRPDSINEDKLQTMKDFGVHRISINPQTMNDETLKRIGRNHCSEDIKEKFRLARNFGFNNINMDLIVGLTGESLEHIQKTCSDILSLRPDSITVHGMSIKKGSRLHENILNKNFEVKPEQDEINKMYEAVTNLAYDMGMKPYYLYRQKNTFGNMENVGFCKEHKEGIYNIQMIEETQSIIALGTDAATKVVFFDENRIERHMNVKDVNEYINRVNEMIDKKINLLKSLY